MTLPFWRSLSLMTLPSEAPGLPPRKNVPSLRLFYSNNMQIFMFTEIKYLLSSFPFRISNHVPFKNIRFCSLTLNEITWPTEQWTLGIISHQRWTNLEYKSRNRHNVEWCFWRCTMFRLAKPVFVRYNENFTLGRAFVKHIFVLPEIHLKLKIGIC